jgi:hypothetical protein
VGLTPVIFVTLYLPPKSLVYHTGIYAHKISSGLEAIGCLVKKKISIACVDRRVVDINKIKCELWADIKSYFDIGDDGLN